MRIGVAEPIMCQALAEILAVDEDEARRRNIISFAIFARVGDVVGIVLADVDRTVGIDTFDPHGMAIFASVLDSYNGVTSWVVVDTESGRASIVIPEVGVTATTPIW